VSTTATDLEPFRCPTCQAKQDASPECRRCKCDLTLVVAMRESAQAMHEACLRRLRSGDYRAALDCALRRHAITPDATSRRLLGVVYLLQGRYQAALDMRDGE